MSGGAIGCTSCETSHKAAHIVAMALEVTPQLLPRDPHPCTPPLCAWLAIASWVRDHALSSPLQGCVFFLPYEGHYWTWCGKVLLIPYVVGYVMWQNALTGCVNWFEIIQGAPCAFYNVQTTGIFWFWNLFFKPIQTYFAVTCCALHRGKGSTP